MKKSYIESAVKSPTIAFRFGVPELIRTAHDRAVPMHILSAGLADVIESYLQYQELTNVGVNVISNRMIFDPISQVIVFAKEINLSFA